MERSLSDALADPEQSDNTELILLEDENARLVERVTELELRLAGATTTPHQREADNARLVEQVAELQRQLAEATAAAQQAQSVEPEGLPDQLSIANIAFRAVTNGYGDEDDTFRNRIGAYLDEHHADIGAGCRERIMTVANQDRTPGRKGRSGK